MKLKNKYVYALAVIAVIFALTSHLMAAPFTIKCPYDGQSMYGDHRVGFGQDAVCWYSHTVWDSEQGRTVKHEAYISCGD